MSTSDLRTLSSAPLLLRAFWNGPLEFERAVREHSGNESDSTPTDAGAQECLELLQAVVERLRSPQQPYEASLYLLKHLAARSNEQRGMPATIQ